MLTDVRIRSKLGLGRGIVENDAIPGVQDIVEDRLRQHRLTHRQIARLHVDRVAAGRGFRCYSLLTSSGKN